MQIDHVLIGVNDLAAAARQLEEQFGLVALDGGRHPGWGTANMIVPLGETYLELIGVVDEDEAAGSDFGRWVRSAVGDTPRPIGWAVRTDIEATATRLGVDIHDGSRRLPDSTLLTWRLAGVAESMTNPPLPFFIEWGAGVPLPGSAPVEHPAGRIAIHELELRGDQASLDAWLGPHDLPLQIGAGEPGIAAVRLSGGIRL